MGVWSKPSLGVLRGVVDAALRASCLSGSEEDEDYVVSRSDCGSATVTSWADADDDEDDDVVVFLNDTMEEVN